MNNLYFCLNGLKVVVQVLFIHSLYCKFNEILTVKNTLRKLFFSLNPVPDVAAEVGRYSDVAKRIIDLAIFGAAQNRSYTRLADFTDTIGNRVSGSKNLEMAIKYMHNAMKKDGLDVRLGEF